MSFFFLKNHSENAFIINLEVVPENGARGLLIK